ncbi:MAG: isopentenyl phosphate kinase [Promethearchaeota archaeon]
MSEAKVTIIKIGGSCFSDKTRPGSFYGEIIDNTARQIHELKIPVIIILGGGSFGHPIAKKYRIHLGRKEDVQDQLRGFCLTHVAMLELSKMVLERFLEQGIEAFPVQPSAIFQTEKGKVHLRFLKVIPGLLKMGMTPVLHGDVVLDKETGFTIISGDQIITEIINDPDILVERLVFLMDVDGLYTKDPKAHDDAKLLEEIIVKKDDIIAFTKEGRYNLEELKFILEDNIIDVTGGIINKIDKLKMIVDKNIEIVFMNGQKNDSILNLFNKSLKKYTRIKFL